LSPPANDIPVYTLSSVSSNGAHATLIGAVFGGEASRVKLDLVPGPDQVKALRTVALGKVTAAGLPEFRFLAFGVTQAKCIGGFTVYDRTGEVAFTSPKIRCPGKVVEEIPAK
jgi:hypothetical protein